MQYKNLIFLFILMTGLRLSGQNIIFKKENLIIDSLAEKNIEKAILYTDSLLTYDFPDKKKLILKNGFLNIQANKYEKSFALFQDVIHSSKDQHTLAEAYIGMGQSKGLSNNKHEAIDFTIKALEIAKKLKDQELEAQSYSLLSYIYFSSTDYNNAIIYAKNAVEIQKKMNNDYSLASLYNNIAVYYEKKNQLDSAQIYSFKTLYLNKSLGETYRIAVSYNNTAKLLEKQNKFDQAIALYEKSIETHDSISSNNIHPVVNLAELYNSLNNPKEATFYYKKAVKIALANGDNISLEKQYSALLNLAIEERNFDLSILYLEKRDSLSKIINSKENQDKIKLIDKQYQQSIIEQQLKQKLEIKQKNQIILSFILALLILGSILLFQNFRNRKLKLQQEKLVLEQKVLRSQMNPHFIFNALTSIQKNLLEADILKSSIALAKFGKLIRQNFEFVNKPLISLDDDLEALKNYIETQQLRFDNMFDYQLIIQEGLDLTFVQIPPMLLQPFVENAIEHGLKAKTDKGNLTIEVSEKNQLFHFEIIDDGVGFDNNNNNNLEDREHAIDIFIKRLKLRNRQEEKSFVIENLKNKTGTKISFNLKL